MIACRGLKRQADVSLYKKTKNNFCDGGRMKLLLQQQTAGYGILLILLMFSGACAGIAPTGKMANLEYALNDALKADAPRYAPLELRFAEDKYQAAKKAIADEEYEQAGRLIDQALLDAQLAQEKALSAKAEKDAFEMRQSIEALQGEADRIKKRQSP